MRTWQAAGLGIAFTLVLIDLSVVAYVQAQTFAKNQPRALYVGAQCVADNSGVDCTFTNVGNFTAAPICMTGLLVRKDNSEKSIKSSPLCSGALGPKESRTVKNYWDGGMANDLCSTEEQSFGKTYTHLDWSKCSFTTDKLVD